MKTAVISDIHGNYRAFIAVLNDAKKQGVDNYIFLGDYIGGLHLENEVVSTLRTITNAHIIRGNGEDYLSIDRNTAKCEQLAPALWSIENITDENKSYLLNLPKNGSLQIDGRLITFSHTPGDMFGLTAADTIGGMNYAKRMREKPFDHADYLCHAKTLLDNDPQFYAAAVSLPDGVYLFGHYHTQWHAEIGGKLLINPGSCGEPFDFNINAPYTILHSGESGWKVEERRVYYDSEAAAREFELSDKYKLINIWGRLTTKGIRTAENQVMFYLEHVYRVADSFGDTSRPYTDKVWRLAAESWDWT